MFSAQFLFRHRAMCARPASYFWRCRELGNWCCCALKVRHFSPFFSILEKLLYFFWVLLFSALLILLRTCHSGWNLIAFWNSIRRKRCSHFSFTHHCLPSSSVDSFWTCRVDPVGLRSAVGILLGRCMSAGVTTEGRGSYQTPQKL